MLHNDHENIFHGPAKQTKWGKIDSRVSFPVSCIDSEDMTLEMYSIIDKVMTPKTVYVL